MSWKIDQPDFNLVQGLLPLAAPPASVAIEQCGLSSIRHVARCGGFKPSIGMYMQLMYTIHACIQKKENSQRELLPGIHYYFFLKTSHNTSNQFSKYNEFRFTVQAGQQLSTEHDRRPFPDTLSEIYVKQ